MAAGLVSNGFVSDNPFAAHDALIRKMRKNDAPGKEITAEERITAHVALGFTKPYEAFYLECAQRKIEEVCRQYDVHCSVSRVENVFLVTIANEKSMFPLLMKLGNYNVGHLVLERRQDSDKTIRVEVSADSSNYFYGNLL